MSRIPYELTAGTATATDTAAELGTPTGVESILLKADLTNANTVYIGDATSQPFPLAAGDSVGLGLDNVGLIYHRTASGAAGLSWIVTK